MNFELTWSDDDDMIRSRKSINNRIIPQVNLPDTLKLLRIEENDRVLEKNLERIFRELPISTALVRPIFEWVQTIIAWKSSQMY